MMAHADYFVGSSTSGIPHIIATLRMTVYTKSQVRTCRINRSCTAFQKSLASAISVQQLCVLAPQQLCVPMPS